jgi:hypothetical protein
VRSARHQPQRDADPRVPGDHRLADSFQQPDDGDERQLEEEVHRSVTMPEARLATPMRRYLPPIAPPKSAARL